MSRVLCNVQIQGLAYVRAAELGVSLATPCLAKCQGHTAPPQIGSHSKGWGPPQGRRSQARGGPTPKLSREILASSCLARWAPTPPGGTGHAWEQCPVPQTGAQVQKEAGFLACLAWRSHPCLWTRPCAMPDGQRRRCWTHLLLPVPPLAQMLRWPRRRLSPCQHTQCSLTQGDMAHTCPHTGLHTNSSPHSALVVAMHMSSSSQDLPIL